MTNEDYYNFFKNIFDIWIEDEQKVEFRQITEIYEEFIKSINPKFKLKKCSCSGKCFESFISLDMNGELYSCNRNYNNKEFYYGNMRDINITKLKQKTKEMSIRRQMSIMNSKCKECELFEECKGGCPANAYSLHNDMCSSDDYFCEANIKIRKYVKKRIEELNLIEEYKEGLLKSKKIKDDI